MLDKLETVTSLERAAHSALLAKRIDAVEQIWLSMLKCSTPLIAQISLLADIVRDDAEYRQMRLSSKWKPAFPDGMTWEKVVNEFVDTVAANAAGARPFVPESVWQQYHAYVGFHARLLLVAFDKGGKERPWYRDQGMLDILTSALPANEFALVEAASVWKTRLAKDALRTQVLGEVRKFLEGDVDVTRALGRAPKIQAALVEALADPESAPDDRSAT